MEQGEAKRIEDGTNIGDVTCGAERDKQDIAYANRGTGYDGHNIGEKWNGGVVFAPAVHVVGIGLEKVAFTQNLFELSRIRTYT